MENGGTVHLQLHTKRVFNGLVEVDTSDIGARVEAGGNQRVVRSNFLRQRSALLGTYLLLDVF